MDITPNEYTNSLENLLIFMCQTYEKQQKELLQLAKEGNDAFFNVSMIQGIANTIPISQLADLEFEKPKYGFREVREEIKRRQCELSNLPPQGQAQICHESAQDNSGCVENNCKCDNASEKTESVTEAFKGELESRPRIEQTKLTRDEILETEPGRELNALIAEHVFEWRKVSGPKTDYDGPCESFDVLVPPTIEDPFPLYPPRGAIKPWWFCRDWSGNISAAWEVFNEIKDLGAWIEVAWNPISKSYRCVIGGNYSNKRIGNVCENGFKTAPEAIVKAALISVLEGETS